MNIYVVDIVPLQSRERFYGLLSFVRRSAAIRLSAVGTGTMRVLALRPDFCWNTD